MTDGRRLTCHVLDLTRGLPAAGMGIRLSRLGAAGPELLVDTATDADGRTGGPLLAGDALATGRYELAFAVGDHFARLGLLGADDDERYLDAVPIHVGIGAAATHVHVALLVTPFAYQTYRGS